MKGIRITIAALLSIASIATAVATPGHANTLRWVNNADITTVDPHGSYGVFNMGFVGNIYESLVRLTRNYKIEPSLALSWERVDSVTWRFKLRPDVKFHNGNAFTADDVVVSLMRAAECGALEVQSDFRGCCTIRVSEHPIERDETPETAGECDVDDPVVIIGRISQHGQRLIQPPLANVTADTEAFALEVLPQLARRNRDVNGDTLLVEMEAAQMLADIAARRCHAFAAQKTKSRFAFEWRRIGRGCRGGDDIRDMVRGKLIDQRRRWPRRLNEHRKIGLDEPVDRRRACNDGHQAILDTSIA